MWSTQRWHVVYLVLVLILGPLHVICSVDVPDSHVPGRPQALRRSFWKKDELTHSEFPVTIVSALYDIKRDSDRGDGRSINEYLNWFKTTLQVKAPAVVFVGAPEHAAFVRQHRQGLPTHVITRPLHKLLFHKVQYLVASNQQTEKWRKCIGEKGQSRLENTLPLYISIIFNKFEFMSEVATANPYRSEYFFWVDAGGSRLVGNFELATSRPWPNVKRLQELDPQGNKIIIPADKDPDQYGLPDDIYKYMCGDGNGFLATIFGGKASAVHQMLADAEEFVYKEMLPLGAVGNEQMFMFIWNARNNSRVAKIPKGKAWIEFLA